MIQDTYKGESWPKKMARFLFWNYCFDIKPPNTAPRILVLAGRNGGDIPGLLSAGIPECNIVAVDICQSALELSQARFPRVVHRQMTAAQAAVKYGPFDVVFLDLCSCLSKPVMDDIMLVSAAMRNNSLLGVNMLRGREQGTIARIVANHEWRSAEYFGFNNDRDELISLLSTPMVRGCKRLLNSCARITYKSNTEASNGVPMLTSLYSVVSWNRYTKYSVVRVLRNNEGSYTHRSAKVPISIHECKKYIATCLTQGVAPARFDLSIREAAALKAHSTMGTYTKEIENDT